MKSALHSHYIIDGVHLDLTPAEMLEVVLEKNSEQKPETIDATVMDESLDPVVKVFNLDASLADTYLEDVLRAERSFPVPFAASYTRGKIAEALIDTMWRSGKFRLDDLPVTAKWTWNDAAIGNMAAFYSSVEATADYLDNLNIQMRRYGCIEGPLSVKFATPFSGAPRIAPLQLVPDPQSWLVYVPFDTSDYHLGGSLLAQTLSLGGGMSPQISDPDYFMDCYEVVREFVEDGIAIAGSTLFEGGLAAAVSRMLPDGVGATLDISDIVRASGEKNIIRILFSEIPGVVLQVRDSDFDYIDAEFLLQDVAFFPLGHPVPGGSGVKVKSSAKTGIQTILDSLIQNAEGED